MYKALVSFSGQIAMAAGEVREIADPSVAEDLLRAGYIEETGKAEKPKGKKAPKGG